MAYENTGTISKNKKKEKPNHPDITGRANINGVDYWVSGWAKTGQSGPFYSLSFKLKDEPSQSPTERRTGLDDDSIPF
jgi:hypothetical protein